MKDIGKLEKLFREGKISRRTFLSQVSAIGLMAALSPSLISSKAIAATPKRGGRFIQGLATGSTTDSLDCGTFPDNGIVNLNWQLRNNLVEIDYRGEPIPELAESREASPDAVQWRFKIRKGVEFSQWKNTGYGRCHLFHQLPSRRRHQICSKKPYGFSKNHQS